MLGGNHISSGEVKHQELADAVISFDESDNVTTSCDFTIKTVCELKIELNIFIMLVRLNL